MPKFYDRLNPDLEAFIRRQHVFFTATAAEGARINLSPKGLDAFRILDSNTVAYMDWTGSGNETAAHIRADGRLTIMLCAFEGPPNILRLYGHGRVLPRSGDDYRQVLAEAFDGEEPEAARQIIVLDIESVQTSCGFGVPVYAYERERPSLTRWAEAEDDLAGYRAANNLKSIDGIPSGHVE
ncbi:pyridoxamine 5'-phosphate oxidase family protein [Bauldia sp.]|uniref:pyridoxamine 5'-phosphate oxidase family protein n=1 Tax=Bauldia sp. TaxID=2575872 RepID=UPI003BAAF74A